MGDVELEPAFLVVWLPILCSLLLTDGAVRPGYLGAAYDTEMLEQEGSEREGGIFWEVIFCYTRLLRRG